MEVVGNPDSFLYRPNTTGNPDQAQDAFFAQSKKTRYGSLSAAVAGQPFLVADFAAGRKSLIIINLLTNTQRILVGFDQNVKVGAAGQPESGLAVEVGGSFTVDSTYVGQIWCVIQNVVDEIRFAELVAS